MLKKLIIFTVLGFLIQSGVGFSTIYKWKDNNGNWTFSDSPPTDTTIEYQGASSKPNEGNSEGTYRHDSGFDSILVEQKDDFDGTKTVFLRDTNKTKVYQSGYTTMWATPLASYDQNNKLKVLTLVFTLESRSWMFIKDQPIEIKTTHGNLQLPNVLTDRDTGGKISRRGITETSMYQISKEELQKLIHSNSFQFRIRGKEFNITSEVAGEVLRYWKNLYVKLFEA